MLLHITGLLAHEVVHLFGYNEAVAVTLQKQVVIGFEDAIKGSAFNIPYKVYSMFISISSSFRNLDFILQEKSSDDARPFEPKVKNIIFILGHMASNIQMIERFIDEKGFANKAFYLQESKDLEQQ